MLKVLMIVCVLIVLTDAHEEPLKCHQLSKRQVQHSCVLSPESTEGPYYIPHQKIRSNVTEGKPGLPLELNLVINDATNCKRLANVVVDIWQCDAMGHYSGIVEGRPVRGRQRKPTNNSTFLRGRQITNENGEVTFHTIYPGWYLGRTAHIHIEVFADGERKHTGQLYFPDEISRQVATNMKPYSSQRSKLGTNAQDFIFQRDQGLKTTLKIIGAEKSRWWSSNRAGLRASLVIGIKA